MKQKNTDDLRQELMSESDLHSYLKRNANRFEKSDFPRLINQVFDRKSITKARLARRAGVSGVYVYQIFGGRRLPSRDKLISLCIGMRATLEESQSLLRAAGMAELYPSSRRDSIIMYGIIHEMELVQVNERLYDEGESILE